jgi:hypothetical protein
VRTHAAGAAPASTTAALSRLPACSA